MRRNLHFLTVLIASLAMMAACSTKPLRVQQIDTEVILIDSSLNAVQDTGYLAHLQPLRDSMNILLDEVIGYLPEAMSAFLPESPLSNWAADALLFPLRANRPDKADFAVVNIGGLRCNWPAGNLTIRSIFELMPFENQVVVLTLSGEKVILLANQMAAQGGQGVSGMTYVIDSASKTARDIRVQGKPVDAGKDYFVVTSDYLSGGADGMDALAQFKEREFIGKKIRTQYIDYAKTLTANNQPIAAKCDGRVRVRE